MTPGDVLRMLLTGLRGGRRVRGGVAVETPERLGLIRQLTEAGHLRPVIDRSYPRAGPPEAFAYVEKGHQKGNVVVTVDYGAISVRPERSSTAAMPSPIFSDERI